MDHQACSPVKASWACREEAPCRSTLCLSSSFMTPNSPDRMWGKTRPTRARRVLPGSWMAEVVCGAACCPPAGSRKVAAAHAHRSSSPGHVPYACSIVSPGSSSGWALSGPQKGQSASAPTSARVSDLMRYPNLPSECIVCHSRLRSSDERSRERSERKTGLNH